MKISAACCRPRSSLPIPVIFSSSASNRFHCRNEDLSRNHLSHASATIDANQEHSTKLLRDRTHTVFRLQSALERAIKGQMEEYSSLAEQRIRLLSALTILKMPESIGETVISKRFDPHRRVFQQANASSDEHGVRRAS